MYEKNGHEQHPEREQHPWFGRHPKREKHPEHGHHPEHGQHPGHGHHHHTRGRLRTWVLSILQQAPKNGVEIMDQIELASQGDWRPSPGSVYPLLGELYKEESISKREDGRYEITEKGKLEFGWSSGMPTRQPRSTDDMIEEILSYISYLEDVKRMDASKIAHNMDKLKNVRDRLTILVDDRESQKNPAAKTDGGL
jgi:DNA-binding PadR family transcriptional regulator